MGKPTKHNIENMEILLVCLELRSELIKEKNRLDRREEIIMLGNGGPDDNDLSQIILINEKRKEWMKLWNEVTDKIQSLSF